MSVENEIVTVAHVCLKNRYICCLVEALRFFVTIDSVATFLKRVSQHNLLTNLLWRNYCFSMGVQTKQKSTPHHGIIKSQENLNKQMLRQLLDARDTSSRAKTQEPSQDRAIELQIKMPSGFCPMCDLKKKKRNHFERCKWG